MPISPYVCIFRYIPFLNWLYTLCIYFTIKSAKIQQKSTKTYKPQKEVPTWYNEYVEEQEQKKKTNDNKQLSDLDELKEFFKPIKKE